MSTLYDCLGVARTATPAEIRRAFRAKALSLHPDKNQHPRAVDMFQQLQARPAVPRG